MADVKQLKINNAIYDIKDDVARNGILDLADIVEGMVIPNFASKADKPLVIEVDDTDITVPSGTYVSVTSAIAAGKEIIVKVTLGNDSHVGYLRLCEDYTVNQSGTSYFFEGNTYLAEIDYKDHFTLKYIANEHQHGYINSDGTIAGSDITIANNDRLVVTDASNTHKIARASLTFDGSTTTQALSKKGTWETFYQKPSTGIPASDLASAVQTSLGKADTSVQDVKVKVGTGTAVSIVDSNKVANVTLDTTPTANSTNTVTSGGIKTALDTKVAKITSTDNAIARYDGTGGQIQNSGVTINDSNHVTAAKFITSGGTSSQFVKGDGSLDNTTYAIKEYQMPTNPFGGSSRAIKQNVINNGFYAADQRATVTLTGFNTTNSHNIFNGSYEDNITISAGGTGIILIESSPALFGSYSYGVTYFSFYYRNIPESVSMRVYGTRSGTVDWYSLGTATPFYGSSQDYCCKISNSNTHSVTKWEITIVAKSDIACSLTQIDHDFSRGATHYMSAVTKYAIKQDLYGTVEAPAFVKRGGTASQFLKANGSVDSNTYLTTSAASSTYAPKASPALTGTPTAPTAASGTNTTQIATTAFVQDAVSNAGAGGSEMVDVTITGTTSSASFSTNPYNAIKAVVDDGKIAVLNANVAPLSTTGVLIPVYEYTYSQSGSNYTGYKGKIQNGNYEISVDVQSTSSATVTITEVSATITVDTALSETSTNPVQNKVITNKLRTKVDGTDTGNTQLIAMADGLYSSWDDTAYLVPNAESAGDAEDIFTMVKTLATEEYVDNLVGDIETLLAAI